MLAYLPSLNKSTMVSKRRLLDLKIDQNISTVNGELLSMKDKFETMDQKFGSIGGKPKNIDNKIKPWPDS
jgi:hypothetical protein